MSKEGKFLIYCIERYKLEKRMTGRETAELFEKYGVSDYIIKYYEALHTTGDKYIIEDIDEYINKRKERYET